jgi:hypothetical protein
MKKSVLIILAVVCFSNILFANFYRHDHAPVAVAKGFSMKYPGTKVRGWKANNDTFIASFVLNKRKHFAYYTDNGTWIRTETKIPWTWDLPSNVKHSWEGCKFNNWYIEEMHEVTSPDKHLFVFKIDNGNLLDSDHHDAFLQKYILCFDINGTLVSKEKRFIDPKIS